MFSRLAVAALITLASYSSLPAQTPPTVLMRGFNEQRTGANLTETILTPARLQAQGLKQAQVLPLTGDARGTEGQPLIVPALTMTDGLKHNVLFSGTMADDVFAYDVDSGVMLWKQHIGNPIPDTLQLDMWLTQGNWGILSTPAINLATNTIFVVAMRSPTGQEANSQFYLHGLSLITGVDQFPPVLLNAATYQPPGGLPKQSLGSVPRKQRPGLLFDSRNGHDTVFVMFGSFVEDADTNRGWIVAIDVTGLQAKISAAFTSTSRYSGGGWWMAGAAPAMDDNGDIYSVSGNGAFDGKTEFSNSISRLHYDPTTGFKMVQWFSPFSDAGRCGADQTLADTSLIPNGGYHMPGGTSNMDSPKDEDLGSAGALLLLSRMTGFGKNVAMAAGKDGILYEVDADNMGNNTNADFAPGLIATNVYGKLLMPPYGFTFYPGNMSLAPTNLALLNTTEFGYSHHQHAQPTFYKSPTYGPMLFTGGENGPVRAFSITSDYQVHYLAQGGDYASANMPPPGGMPGSMCTLSANGSVANTGILWCTQPQGDANKTVTPGYLVAYAADSFANGALVKLFDSRQHGITFMFDKFDPPIEWNGEVFVPDYGGNILVLH